MNGVRCGDCITEQAYCPMSNCTEFARNRTVEHLSVDDDFLRIKSIFFSIDVHPRERTEGGLGRCILEKCAGICKVDDDYRITECGEMPGQFA